MGFKSLHKYFTPLGSCVKLYTIFSILFFNQLYGDISAEASKSGTHIVPRYVNSTNYNFTVTVTFSNGPRMA